MNKKDEIKIDVLSSIDDDLIEKHSQKRYELTMKPRKNRKRVIAWLSAAASFMLIFGILLAVIIPTLTKQVPVYQGMTVSGEFPSAQSAKADAENLLPAYMPVSLSLTEPTYINPYNLSTGNGKGNANGHDKNGKNEIPEETVVEQVKDRLNIVGGEKSIYYAEKNQDIYITVHVDNPDSFEILSFTLNGKKYSSYMFEEGSDMENLVLKVNVGDTEGVIDYTIDAIKYIDGTEIKDVRMEGDKTVKVGVATDKQPTAVISSEKIAFNDIFFSITVTDALKLIELSGGRVDAVLYEGENIIATKSISITEGTGITFDNLKPATEYTYVIAASYDALDGSGFNTYILAAKTFTTLEALMFNNVTVGQENVSFNLLWDEKYIEREIVSISLYQGEAKIKDIETTATAIDGLLCDNEYTVIVEYKNNGKTDNVYLTFTTAAKAKPTVAITRSSITQTSVEFGVSFTDTDGVGEISKIELLHGSGNRTAENTAVRSFSGLLSNNTYTVKVTYTYDLNDSKGIQTDFGTLDIKTNAKTAPTLSVTRSSITQTSVEFGVSFTDTDGVGEISRIELLHRSGNKTAENTAVRSFSGLLSNNTYTVKVTYTYDLNDGKGIQTDFGTLDLKTAAKAIPTLSITEPTKTQTSVGFGIDYRDPDAVGVINKIELVHATQGTVAADNLNVREFKNLLSNNIYTVKVSYTYNLNDGQGDHIEIKKLDIRTEPKLKPVIEIADLDYNIKHIEFNVTETDVDNTGGVTKVELYQGDTLARTSNSLTGALFDELLSDTEYTVKITYEYDLNDGVGKHTETVTETIKTRYDFGVGDWEPSKGLEITNGVITGIGSCNDTVLFIDKPIGYQAFRDSMTLEKVYIYCGGKDSFIGSTAFRGCICLTSVTITDGVTTIPYYAFADCINLTSVTIPESVTSIGTSAFSNCKGLTSITIPESLTSIGWAAFYGCTGLTGITIPNGVTSIGADAFERCTGLTSITIPDSVTSIGKEAFHSCSGLTSVTISKNVMSIGEFAFSGCTGLTSITIPNGVTSIGEAAFYGCTGLTSITLLNGVTSIGNSAFSNCTGLTSIKIPDSVISIGSRSFLGCVGLTSITIPDSVKSIGESAFYGCTGLTDIKISNSVMSIGDNAFYGCYSIKSITIPNSVKVMGASVFAETSGLTVYVANGTDTTAWNSDWYGNATVVYLTE